MTMSHKELLELAAKAAGLRPDTWGWDGVGFREYAVMGVPHRGFIGPVWNPLFDDGDALRLAVKLGITPHQYTTCVSAKRHKGDGIDCEETFSHCKYAATRRAIVRAAAEIGKTMKCQ